MAKRVAGTKYKGKRTRRQSEARHFRALQERWRSNGDKVMEDKRKEELKNKIDKIHDLNGKIGACESLLEDAADMLEFLDTFQCHTISLTGYGDDEGYRENVLMPLSDNDIKEVEDLIKKKLRNRIEEYDGEISKAYQELDKLLK
nr:MAG TPA: hypothetical protein [Caudoviricetes sp.]